MHLVNGTGNSPSLGQPTPGVVKQDKSSGGSVDTTKTRSGPKRVRMSSGERPIGAAKGKQSETEALCQPRPPFARATPLSEQTEGVVSATFGDSGASDQPPRKAAKVAPREAAGGDKRPVPRGQLGEASPAAAKRARRGERDEAPHPEAEEAEPAKAAPAPRQANRSMPPPPPRCMTGKGGGLAQGLGF